MQNFHFNIGSLGLTYLTTLLGPTDPELFSQNSAKKNQSHKVAIKFGI